MRIDVRKFLFLGLEEQREQFFKTAQRAGIIHFIDSNPTPYKHVPEEIDRVLAAIKIVRELPVMEQEEAVDFDHADELVSDIIRLRETIDKRVDQARFLKLEWVLVAIFGDFNKDDITYLDKYGHRKIQFYCGPQGSAEHLDGEANLIHVGNESGLDYFVAINSDVTQYPGLIEMKIDKPAGELRQQLQRIEQERHDAEVSLKTYAKYEDFLHDVLKVKLNHANLVTAQAYADKPLNDTLFAVEGWVPESKIQELQPLLQEMAVHCEEVAIDPNDAIPTCLENQGASRIGEDLVHIYDTPAHTDKDPSLWVLCFFALFFAMIVGDGGYGLVFLGIAIYLKLKFTKVGDTGRRFFNLVTILATACILWGISSASFFGISLGVDNPLRKVSLITWLAEKKAEYYLEHRGMAYEYWLKKYPEIMNIKTGPEFLRLASKDSEGNLSYEILAKFSDQIFLEMVLVVAIIHIICSLVRYMFRNWSAIGWIIFLIGAFLYIPHTFLDTITFVQYVLHVDLLKATEAGKYLLAIGFSVAVILAIFQHKLLGLTEIMATIQVFADVMSYLRLYALGLAGAMVASTLNEMAAGLPFVLGLVLMVAGHAVNMVLAIAGGIIHGLRLNFLEWYHYSFVGGGKPFQPLHFLEVTSAAKQD